jgi:hypothetical protein
MDAAKKGYIAYTNCTSTLSEVVPFGGKFPVLGTNPHSWGLPTTEACGFPVVIDWATSTVAMGRVQQLRRENKPLPEPLFTRPAAEPGTETAPASQPAPAERPVLASRKQLKHAARRLIEAKVSREAVEAFRKEGALGHWTVQAVEDRVNEMIHVMAVA